MSLRDLHREEPAVSTPLATAIMIVVCMFWY
jgi:hypothetical protein